MVYSVDPLRATGTASDEKRHRATPSLTILVTKKRAIPLTLPSKGLPVKPKRSTISSTSRPRLGLPHRERKAARGWHGSC
jgi:hypothetical protein